MKFTLRFRGGAGLCCTCRTAQRVVDDRGQEAVLCHAFGMDPPMQIRREVVECSQHDPVNVMSKWEMEKIAWVLETRGERPVGFRPPKKEDEDK